MARSEMFIFLKIIILENREVLLSLNFMNIVTRELLYTPSTDLSLMAANWESYLLKTKEKLQAKCVLLKVTDHVMVHVAEIVVVEEAIVEETTEGEEVLVAIPEILDTLAEEILESDAEETIATHAMAIPEIVHQKGAPRLHLHEELSLQLDPPRLRGRDLGRHTEEGNHGRLRMSRREV